MSLGKYLSSRVFVAQMVAALVLIAVLAFAFFHWITFITHHGDEITVPNLSNLTPEQIEDKLSDLDLDYEIIDTVDYNPAFQKLTIVQQEPIAGSKVKGGRTIYVKLNAATFTMVAVPDLIEKTYRQAVPTLKSIGLLEGEITYVPYIGKDMVRKMMMNGKEIKPGTKVLKSSKIDLVLGDGKVVFDSTEIDSLLQEENQVDTLTNAE